MIHSTEIICLHIERELKKELFSIIFGITLIVVYTPPAFGGFGSCNDDSDCPIRECAVFSCINSDCIPNSMPAGTPCGDPTDNDCTNPDTCNGSITCLPRNEPQGTSCDANEDSCTTDQCDNIGRCVAGPSECVVGGEMIPIGTTSLILAGTQSAFSWMIPITVSAIGIAIVIAKKFSKYQPE